MAHLGRGVPRVFPCKVTDRVQRRRLVASGEKTEKKSEIKCGPASAALQTNGIFLAISKMVLSPLLFVREQG